MSATSRVATCCLALTAASCAGGLEFEGFSWSALQQKISVPTPTLEALPSANVPAPEGLRATSGVLRAIPLKWDPMLRSDVAGYLVERAALRDGPFERAARIEGRLLTAYLDRGEAERRPEADQSVECQEEQEPVPLARPDAGQDSAPEERH